MPLLGLFKQVLQMQEAGFESFTDSGIFEKIDFFLGEIERRLYVNPQFDNFGNE